MNKPKLWFYKSGIKKGKLRTLAKEYLSYKLKAYWKERKLKELLVIENKKFTYSIKLTYKSSRAEKGHDLVVEAQLIYISKYKPTYGFLRNFIIDHLEDLGGGEPFLLGIPYTDVIVGLIKEEKVNEIESHEFSHIKFSHTI